MADKLLALMFGLFSVFCAGGIVYNLFIGKNKDKVFEIVVVMLLCYIISRLLRIQNGTS